MPAEEEDKSEKAKPCCKKWLLVAAVAFAALFVVAAAAAAFAFALNAPASSPSAASSIEESGVLFEARHGMSIMEIAASLENEGLVKSAAFAALYARAEGLSLKAGTYLLYPSMTTAEILQILHEGDVARIKVTVPEGLTLSKTAALFEKAGIEADDFVAAASDEELLAEFGIPARTAEGYLFPDTYFLDYGEGAKSIARRMVSTFFEKAGQLEDAPTDSDEMHKRVILASIVEREYRAPEEAPIIAGVFENRLSINMGLQSCATIEYIITEIMGEPHPERLTSADLEIPSAYNTYLWAGLPPGPISNPSLTALAAAFSPAQTPYFYFRLSDASAGTHVFTASLDEHIEAGRELYLKAAAGL